MAKSQEFSTFSEASGELDFARKARLTVRQAFTGSLATLDQASGYPFASLVSVASSAEGDVILLLSGLARHTKNIAETGKASVLLEAPIASSDPLAASRVTLQGDITKTQSVALRTRYLARHPEAEGYADFADFAFYELHVSSAHFIAGFGRIHSFAREAVCLDGCPDASSWDGAKLDAASAAHQDDLRLAWRRQVGSEPHDSQLKIVSMDGDGLDVRNGEAVHRLNFATVVDGSMTGIDTRLTELLGSQPAQEQ